MRLPVVVGVDGSEGSLRALDWAAAEASRSRLPLRVVHASLWEHYEGLRPTVDAAVPGEQLLAEHLVASARDRVRDLRPEVSVVADVQPEDPVAALVQESHEASLVVLGSRGRGRIAGMLLGSVGLALAGRSHCPVVVIPARQPGAPPQTGRIVVGISDDAGPSAAAVFALAQAASRHGELTAVRAWRRPAHTLLTHPPLPGVPFSTHRRQAEKHLDEVLKALETLETLETRKKQQQTQEPQGTQERQETQSAQEPQGTPGRDGSGTVVIHRSVAQGPAHQVLIEAAENAELLVVGARRSSGWRGLQLGPVNHAVLHYAPCPVAIVPDTYQG
ncbi:universal stress protein [Streptomyces sp. NBC_00893]|uniref:universal stress protein n=1 Tax=Streptomyces sp. NBC_00893 TaxID=2975862 RepID=UPI002257D14D|nr:universal stress protein [Streptomyces sp. NBC_00893]MCX4847260.1 universal stress protein [Streptomyces sp. NBC_00893]